MVHFTHATFDFLRKLRSHNDKSWFETHKSDYRDHVLLPLQALTAELGSLMQSIDPEIEITPGKVISRAHRDTRFSKDKSPYKTSHWMTFKRSRKEWQNFPAFFFEISPDGYRYGMGFFSADRGTMDRFRACIDANPAAFLTRVAFHSQQKDLVIEGEQYKRPLKTNFPSDLLADWGRLNDWYQRKNFYLVRNGALDTQGIPPGLTDALTRDFQTLAPLYHDLLTIVASP